MNTRTNPSSPALDNIVVCIYLSIKQIGASVTSIFEATYPLFIVVFSAWLARTRPPLYLVLGALMVVGGVAVIGYGRSKGAP